MGKISETSFGARLARGYSLLTYVSSYYEFLPPRELDRPENLKILLDDITQSNAEVTRVKEMYAKAVYERQQLFKGSPESMIKKLSPILGAVVAQYGRDSVEYKLIASINKKIRLSHIEKTPTNPNDLNAEQKVIKSDRSYGSLTQHFCDIITNLKQFDNYKPTNKKITIDSLTAFSGLLTASNQAVTFSYGERSKKIAIRKNIYIDLRERTNRIKGYTKSTFGFKSEEYKLIKGLKF